MPAFPQKFHSTVSHWQQTNRGPTSLWNHGRKAQLPTDKVVDYVIIGAGASGTSLAYHLSRAGGAAEGKSVVILDAKDVASGASGRNGGHVPTQTWRMFAPFMAPKEKGGAGLSADDVLDIIFFMQDNLDLVERLVQEEGIDADFKRTQRFEVLTTPEGVAENERLRKFYLDILARSTKHKGRSLDVEVIWDTAQAKKMSRVKNALAVNRAIAGSWHPHRGVTALMRRALESKHADVKFFSWAPVAGFTENADGTVSVDCGDRGIVTARKLIVATCAYTHHLMPELKNIYRLQAGLVVPPASFSGEQALNATYAVEQAAYLIQTPNAGFVFGPYEKVAVQSGLTTKQDMYNVEDDSVTTAPYREWLSNFCRTAFAGWGEETPGEGLTTMWSGILCHSVDLIPMVGPVPGRTNTFMTAGYSGMGMAMIINITRGLANQLKTGEWDETVPRCFQLTEERLDKAKECLQPREYSVPKLDQARL